MADADVVLVAGATGNTGSGVAASLLAEGRKVRALVHDEAKAAGLRDQGAEVAVVDLDRPETLSDDLLDGVGAVYFVIWNGATAYQQSKALLDTILSSGARPHIVRLSGYGTPESRIISELERCEDALKSSGLPWTIVKPTFFMQNLLMSAPSIQEQGTIYYDWASGKAGIVDVRDVIDAAVGVLTGRAEGVEGQTFVLTGPESIGMEEIARALSEVTGQEIQYVPVPHEAARDAMVGMGVPEWIAEGYAELSRGFADGYADLTTDNVKELSGHEPRSFGEFARDFAEMFTGDPARQHATR